MVYKKYVWKNGKKMGPYFYESYREGDQIKKRYLGSEQKKSFVWFYLTLGILLVVLLYFLFPFDGNVTGRATLSLVSEYRAGENINGNLKLSLQSGELIPEDSKVIVSLNNQSKEFLLSELVTGSRYSGNFYSVNSGISGVGEGFGVYGEKLIYPEVDFKLSISSASLPDNQTNQTQPPSNQTQPPVNDSDKDNNKDKEKEKDNNKDKEKDNDDNKDKEKDGENAAGNTNPSSSDSQSNAGNKADDKRDDAGNLGDSNKEKEKDREEDKKIENTPSASEKAAQTSSENPSSGESSPSESPANAPASLEGSVLTGAVISDEEFIVEGKVSKEKDFVYSLGVSEKATIVSGSVEYNDTSIGDDKIVLSIGGGEARVSTDYSYLDTGFGSGYSGNNSVVLNIDISKFGIIADNGVLNIELKYNGNSIISVLENISVEGNLTGIINVTNETIVVNITNITLPLNLTNVTLPQNITLPLNLTNLTLVNMTNFTINNMTNFTFISNISRASNWTGNNLSFIRYLPAIKIIGNNSVQINLSNYFIGAERYEFEGANIIANFSGEIISLRAEPDFSGLRKATISAYRENYSLGSNDFWILVSSGNLNIQTIRDKVNVGEPVKWIKNISSDVVENLTIELPVDAVNITVKKYADSITQQTSAILTNLKGGVISGRITAEFESSKKSNFFSYFKKFFSSFGITGEVVSAPGEMNTSALNESAIQVQLSDGATNYLVEYYTASPQSSEENTAQGKKVVVSAADELNYTDVIARTSIDNSFRVQNEGQIKVYWHNYDLSGSPDLIKKVSDIKNSSVVEDTAEINTTAGFMKSTDLAAPEVLKVVYTENISDMANISENNLSLIAFAGKIESSLSNINLSSNINYALQEVPFEYYDYDEDGNIDHLEWVVPHFSNQTYTIVLSSENTTTVNVTYDGDYSHLTVSSNPPYYQSGYGLMAYWNFDGDNSSVAFDYSKYNIDGKYLNFSYSDSVGCIYGGCVKFNGVNSSVTGTLPSGPTQFTITAWINLSEIGREQHIAEFTNVQFYASSGNKLGTAIWSDAAGTTTLNKGTWYFVSLTRNATNSTLYLNGNVEGVGKLGVDPGGAFFIGRLYIAGNYYFNGSIDEVMVFNHSLNSSQILDIYNNQSSRFVYSGTEEAKQLNISAGSKIINLRIDDYQRKFGSNISTRLGSWEKSFGYKDWDFGNHYASFENAGVDSISIADNETLRFNDATFAAWVYLYSPTSDISWRSYIYKAVGIDTNAREYALYLKNDGGDKWKIHLSYGNGTTTCGTNTVMYLDRQRWYHIVVTREISSATTQTVKYYTDGLLNYSVVCNIVGYYNNGTAPLYLGNSFNGSLDEVMLFNQSLNADEVSRLYQQERDGYYNHSNLVSRYRFNDGTANDLKSLNNGTFQSGAYVKHDQTPGLVSCWHFDSDYKDYCRKSIGTAINQTNLNAFGFYNQSVTFDGVGDYINDSSFIWNSTGGPVTVAFWNYVTSGTTSSAFGAGTSDDPNRFQAHVPYSDNLVYWDYGQANATGRINTSYVGYYNKWTHVALVSAGRGGNLKAIYLDGKLVNSDTVSMGPSINLSGINIGRAVMGSMIFDHSGKIDEFMMFNRTLSASEIKEIYIKGRAQWVYSSYKNLTSSNIGDTSSRSTFVLPTSFITNVLPSFNLLSSAYQFYTPLLSGNSTSILNALYNNVTSCTVGSGCLFIQTGYGFKKAIFDKLGNIDIAGVLTEGSAGTPNGQDFIIQNRSGSVVAWIDNIQGNMNLAGYAIQDVGGYCTAPASSFIIKDNSGNCVSYIDSSGNLWAKGLFNQQSNI